MKFKMGLKLVLFFIRWGLRAKPGHRVTQMHYARRGEITPEMEFVALREGMRPEIVRLVSCRRTSGVETDGLAILARLPRSKFRRRFLGATAAAPSADPAGSTGPRKEREAGRALTRM